MVRANRPKMGVWTHGLAHHAEQVKTFLPTNVAIADAMGSGFMRERGGFTVNSRAGRSQLLRWTLDQKKPWPVTGKRIRRRQDMRSAPVGPAGGVSNVHTEQGVSSRGQPVQGHGHRCAQRGNSHQWQTQGRNSCLVTNLKTPYHTCTRSCTAESVAFLL